MRPVENIKRKREGVIKDKDGRVNLANIYCKHTSI
jgi:hypothetical protein